MPLRKLPACSNGASGVNRIGGKCATRWPLLRIDAPVALVIPFTSKNSHRDGTTHLVLEPLDLMVRLSHWEPDGVTLQVRLCEGSTRG